MFKIIVSGFFFALGCYAGEHDLASVGSVSFCEMKGEKIDSRIPIEVMNAYAQKIEIALMYEVDNNSPRVKNLCFFDLENLETPLGSLKVDLTDREFFELRPNFTFLRDKDLLFVSTSNYDYVFDFLTSEITYLKDDVNRVKNHVRKENYFFFNSDGRSLYGYDLCKKKYFHYNSTKADLSLLVSDVSLGLVQYHYDRYSENFDNLVYYEIGSDILKNYYFGSREKPLNQYSRLLKKVETSYLIKMKNKSSYQTETFSFVPLDKSLVKVKHSLEEKQTSQVVDLNYLPTKKVVFELDTEIDNIYNKGSTIALFSNNKLFAYDRDYNKLYDLQEIDVFTKTNTYGYLSTAIQEVNEEVLYYRPIPSSAGKKRLFHRINRHTGKITDYSCKKGLNPMGIIKKKRTYFSNYFKGFYDLAVVTRE